MSQVTQITIDNVAFGTFRSNLNDTLNALNSMHSGTSRPASATTGTIWLDTTNAGSNSLTIKFFDGTDDITVADVDTSANTINFIDSTVATELLNDLSPQLGGNLDLNSNDITGTGDINITGDVTATSFSGDGSGLTGVASGGGAFRNLIINGDMSIAQRGTSVSSYGSVSYSTVDRFKTVFEVGTYTVSQESLSSGEAYNNGFRKAFKALVTSTASPPSAGSQTTFEQRIEGQMCQAIKKGTSNAESLTLSFWVRSSKTGTNLQVNLRDTDNTRQVGGTYNISSADTWEKKTITFPPDTTGALNNDNGSSLTLEWFLDGGSNYSGGAVPTSWEASSNADRNVTNFDLAGGADDWWITGVQLEVGTSASDFEFLPYDVNLFRCQRYFTVINNNGRNGDAFFCGHTASSTAISGVGYSLATPLRIGNPTITKNSGVPMQRCTIDGFQTLSAGAGTIGLTAEAANSYMLCINLGGFSGMTSSRPAVVSFPAATNAVTIDAEL